jgi:Salmonella virulence plasmid 65kDa B protein
VVTERDGTRVFYGLEPDHRLHDDAGRISAWYASKKQDANGNEVIFAYIREVATKDVRLTSVEWAGCYRVSLIYEGRPDPVHSFRAGFEHLQQHRLVQVDVEVQTNSTKAYHAYRTYQLTYIQSGLTGRSMLTRVAVTGFNPDGARHNLPPLSFGYTEPDLAQRTWHSLSGALPGGSLQDRNLTLVRQSGSGLPDLLETTETGHWLRENLGDGRFGSAQRVSSPGQVLLENAGTFISDMNGDGWGDLVVNGGTWVYRGVAGGGWGLPYASAQAPAWIWRRPMCG